MSTNYIIMYGSIPDWSPLSCLSDPYKPIKTFAVLVFGIFTNYILLLCPISPCRAGFLKSPTLHDGWSDNGSFLRGTGLPGSC